MTPPVITGSIVKWIRRITRNGHDSEEESWIVLDALPGEDTIAGLYSREPYKPSVYYPLSTNSLEVGKKVHEQE
ncbi:MAG: hypothetical protein V3U24_05965 [Candidatus Neomarinimicrobiota bacterium]